MVPILNLNNNFSITQTYITTDFNNGSIAVADAPKTDRTGMDLTASLVVPTAQNRKPRATQSPK